MEGLFASGSPLWLILGIAFTLFWIYVGQVASDVYFLW